VLLRSPFPHPPNASLGQAWCGRKWAEEKHAEPRPCRYTGKTQYAFPDATVFGRDENGDLKDPLNENRVIGSCTLLFLVSIVYVGISYISKFAMLFLTGVLTAIFSIFLGVFVRTGYPNEDKGVPGLSWDNFSANWGPDYTTIDGESYSFSILLALFFPAVTDPLAGSNLSGDLRDAAKSIPPGTLLAVGFTTLIFLSQVCCAQVRVDCAVVVGRIPKF
jgi:hypothetical protein